MSLRKSYSSICFYINDLTARNCGVHACTTSVITGCESGYVCGESVAVDGLVGTVCLCVYTDPEVAVGCVDCLKVYGTTGITGIPCEDCVCLTGGEWG